jgi:hypothetical protein
MPASLAIDELVRRHPDTCCEVDVPFIWTVRLIGVVLAILASFLAAPFARLALRMWPVDPFGWRTFRNVALMTVSLAVLVAVAASVWFTFDTLVSRSFDATSFGLSDRPYYDPRRSMETILHEAVASFCWRSVLLAVVCMFVWSHLRARRALNGRFAIFLRRFSGFADGALVIDLMKSMPRSVPLVFIASRHDQARNWDPFVWAFGGLRLLRPLKNLPIQCKTNDATWTQTVETLVAKAHCVIIDISERSPSIETEWQLVQKVGAQDRVVALADPRLASGDLMRACSSVIRYSPNFRHSALSCAVKVALAAFVWFNNTDSLWGWLVLLLVPFLIKPSISRAAKRDLRSAVANTFSRNPQSAGPAFRTV